MQSMVQAFELEFRAFLFPQNGMVAKAYLTLLPYRFRGFILVLYETRSHG